MCVSYVGVKLPFSKVMHSKWDFAKLAKLSITVSITSLR